MSREINPQAMMDYLSLRYVPGNNSIFKQVKRLPPAHGFTYDLRSRNMRTWRYWSPKIATEKGLSQSEWQIRIREKLASALKRWTISDVPYAFSLSGGLDSSILVGLMSQQTSKPVNTFSLGFEQGGLARKR